MSMSVKCICGQNLISDGNPDVVNCGKCGREYKVGLPKISTEANEKINLTLQQLLELKNLGVKITFLDRASKGSGNTTLIDYSFKNDMKIHNDLTLDEVQERINEQHEMLKPTESPEIAELKKMFLQSESQAFGHTALPNLSSKPVGTHPIVLPLDGKPHIGECNLNLTTGIGPEYHAVGHSEGPQMANGLTTKKDDKRPFDTMKFWIGKFAK